jgi:cytoskeletal protein RodZ
MDETTKEKFNWQRLLITLGLVIVAAGLVGGGIWYYMNQNEQAQTKSYNDSVSSLQKQINELKAAKTATATTPSTSTTTTDPTAGWKTYNDTVNNYGFTLKYPTDWTATGITMGVRLTKGNEYFDVLSYNNPSAQTTESWLQQEINLKNIASASVADKTTKTIGNNQVLYFTHNGQDVNYYYFLGNNSKMLEIYSDYGADSSIKTTMEDVIKTITFN